MRQQEHNAVLISLRNDICLSFCLKREKRGEFCSHCEIWSKKWQMQLPSTLIRVSVRLKLRIFSFFLSCCWINEIMIGCWQCISSMMQYLVTRCLPRKYQPVQATLSNSCSYIILYRMNTRDWLLKEILQYWWWGVWRDNAWGRARKATRQKKVGWEGAMIKKEPIRNGRKNDQKTTLDKRSVNWELVIVGSLKLVTVGFLLQIKLDQLKAFHLLRDQIWHQFFGNYNFVFFPIPCNFICRRRVILRGRVWRKSWIKLE